MLPPAAAKRAAPEPASGMALDMDDMDDGDDAFERF
jgi:hypothetical protein